MLFSVKPNNVVLSLTLIKILSLSHFAMISFSPPLSNFLPSISHPSSVKLIPTWLPPPSSLNLHHHSNFGCTQPSL